MVVSDDDVHKNETVEFTYWLYYMTVYYVLKIICVINAFLNVQQYKRQEQQTISTTTSTLVGMNVMGQLIDKAKRAIVMRTVNNEKLQQEQTSQEKTQHQSSQSNVRKPILPIRIQELDAKIENRPTIVDEKSPAVLKYRTPHFRYC
ncbi:unnamed protein product [Rotaria magnacalcarata]|uniref:Uncharacterized protein n=1 Tax=Rotaria magnacalcarata TaxID=392030 RepID=A0A816SLT6_9BILA|nr:unnamed protein product [Rotaria magnacalcarata]